MTFFFPTAQEFQTLMVLCYFNKIERGENLVTSDYFPNIVTTLPLQYLFTHPSEIILSFIIQLLGNCIASD